MLVTNLILLLQIAPNVITNIGNRLSIVSYRYTGGILAVLVLKDRNREFLKVMCNLSREQARMINLVSITLRKHFLHHMVLPQVGMRRKRFRSLVLKVTWEK
jgi:hypothetical protein